MICKPKDIGYFWWICGWCQFGKWFPKMENLVIDSVTNVDRKLNVGREISSLSVMSEDHIQKALLKRSHWTPWIDDEPIEWMRCHTKLFEFENLAFGHGLQSTLLFSKWTFQLKLCFDIQFSFFDIDPVHIGLMAIEPIKYGFRNSYFCKFSDFSINLIKSRVDLGVWWFTRFSLSNEIFFAFKKL